MKKILLIVSLCLLVSGCGAKPDANEENLIDESIEDVYKEDIKLVQNQEVIVVRDEIIPIIRLRSVLGLPEEEDKDMMMGVIVKKGEKQVLMRM